MIAYNIEWDVDEPENTDYLPNSVTIPEELVSNLNDNDSLVDIVSDYLTEKTGFCHNGFVIDMSCESETCCKPNTKEN